MMRVQAIGAGHALFQSRLNGFRRSSRRNAQAVGEPEDMGVDRHGGLSKRRIQNNIGCFSTYAWQRFKCFAGARNFSVMPL